MAAKEHPSRGLHGLRLINNVVTADGSGRDALIFNNPGFAGGRKTPAMKDKSLDMQGGRPPVTPYIRGRGSAWSLAGDGRRAGFGHSAGTTGKPTGVTVSRWKRVHSEPTYLDQLGKTTPAQPVEDTAVRKRPDVDANIYDDDLFKPNNRKHDFKIATFPVEKYNYFSSHECLHRKIPHEDSGRATLGRLEIQGRYGEGGDPVRPKLENPVTDKYLWFSDDHVRRSPNFQSVDGHTGLAARATLGGPGLMRASLAALPKPPMQHYPFGPL